MELIVQILTTFLWIMWIAIIGRAVMSWIDRSQQNPISQFLIQLTEPIIAPIRRIMPQTGMIDLSPMIAIMVIWVLMTMLRTAMA